MIQENLYEIIALIVILTSLVIYFLIIRFKQEAQNDFDFPDKANLKQINPKRNRRGKVAKKIIESNDNKVEPFIINSSDERNFGSIYIPVEEDDINNNDSNEEEIKEIKKKNKIKSNKKNKHKKVVVDIELNTTIGLASCDGDSGFYKEILKEFSLKYSDSPKELSTLLKNTDTKLFDEILFELIGIASYIGAENIKSILNNLNKATKNSKEKSYSTIIDEYEIHLNILLKEIKNYL